MATTEIVRLVGAHPAGDIEAELATVFGIAELGLGRSESGCGCPSCFSTGDGGFPCCC